MKKATLILILAAMAGGGCATPNGISMNEPVVLLPSWESMDSKTDDQLCRAIDRAPTQERLDEANERGIGCTGQVEASYRSGE